MALTTLDTSIKCILLLTTQPREITAAYRELIETRQDPAQHLVGIIALGDHSNLRGMSTEEAFLRSGLASQHVTIDDTDTLRSVVTVGKQR